MNNTNASTANNLPKPKMQLLIITAVLTFVGLACWLIQLIQGPEVLAVGNGVPWGIYIAAFFLLAGIGSGLIVLAVLGDLEALPSLKSLRRSLLIAAIACFIAAGFMILMDLGKPARVFNIIFSPNFKSMFVWDFYFLTLSVILALVYLFRRPNKIFASIIAITAIVVVLAEGWILTINAGNALWHSSLIPVLFLVEAMITAGAIVLFIGDEKTQDIIKKLLLILLPIILLFSMIELVSGRYMPDSATAVNINLMLKGNLGLLYWGQLLVGVIIPFALLLQKGRSIAMIRMAAIFILLGALAAKLNLLIAGQALPFMGDIVHYTPTIVEFGALIGGLGLAAFLFLLGKRFILGINSPAQSEEKAIPS